MNKYGVATLVYNSMPYIMHRIICDMGNEDYRR